MRQFFVLVKRPMAPDTAFETRYLAVGEARLGEAPRCPTCDAALGPRRWLPPYRVELEAWGLGFGDIAFGPSMDLLVSERFVQVWTTARLVGLNGFDPVEVLKVRKHGRVLDQPPTYLHVDVVRSETTVDTAASGVVRDERPICPDCRLGGIISEVHGVALEASIEPAEDIFVARGLPGTIFVSQRCHDLFSSASLRNVLLIPASEYHFPKRPGGAEN